MYRNILSALLLGILFSACKHEPQGDGTITFADTGKLTPVIITDPVNYDTDDPAIWINQDHPEQSLIAGTDKNTNGAIFVFNLQGKITGRIEDLKRPNNIDIAYHFPLNGKPTDIMIATERETNKLRIYRLPDLQPIDNGGIAVFSGESDNGPMGIAIYTRSSDSAYFAVVSRKSGPPDGYLWQYQLTDSNGFIARRLVRKFGKYSGKKEIESVAVDNENGYVYYSDEMYGVHQYYADPQKGNEELALFGQHDFKEDIEGISIYKHTDGTGYILVSNQQANTFVVYPREGTDHLKITEIAVSTDESDGSDVTNIALGGSFPQGLFVAMSNGRVFHYYDWRDIQKRIDAAGAHK